MTSKTPIRIPYQIPLGGKGNAKIRCMTTTPQPVRGYTASKDQLLARLRRIEGQIRGIEGMVQDDRYCIDILTQITAAQAALDKVALGLLDGHAHSCVIGAEPDQRDARTDEMMAAVGRLLRRG
jgi:CsoR family transcriptional regulator, copper-sensing transcriptional repressor